MTALSIADAAVEAGDRIGLIAGDDELPFARLAELAHRAPTVDRITAAPTVDTVVAIYAALAARRSITLIHPRLTATERAALPPPPHGIGIAVYTSGSSGRPKPVLLSPEMLLASAQASAAHLGWRDDDRWLCPLPLAHVGGLSVITRCLIARRCAAHRALRLGGPFVLSATSRKRGRSRRTPLAQGERVWKRITLASVVPAQLAGMIEATPPPALRAVLVGGAAAAPALLARARDRGFPVLATYGMTEACSQIATERRPGDGLSPLAGMELRFDAGRILVRGPAVAADGWLDTGDLGELDDRGRLVVHGRADDVIVTGGENVHPLEVERALLAVPGVREAYVVGTPDQRWGEIVTAVVVGDVDPDTARRHLEPQLAAFKLPRRFEVVGALPRTPSGKPDRAAIRRKYGSR